MLDPTTLAAYRAAQTAQARAQAVRDSLGSGTLTVELREGASLVYTGSFSGPMTAGADGSLSASAQLAGLVTTAGTPNAATWTCRIANGSGRYIEGSFGPGGRFTWSQGTLRVGDVVRLDVSIAAAGGGLPAWRQGMAQWEWKELAGTAAFSGAKPTDTRYGADSSRLNAWNGFAAHDRSVYIAGMGGHGDYQGNEAYTIDLSVTVPQWVMLREPTAWEDIVDDAAYFADGRPNSAHLYYSLWVVGGNLIRLANRSPWPSGGNGAPTYPHVDEFDLTAGDWLPAGTWPDAPSKDTFNAICKDPRDGTIYQTGASHLWKRNPTTGAWTQLVALPDNGSAMYYRAAAVDTLRDRIVFFGDGFRAPVGGFVYDIAANSLSVIDFSSADANASAQAIAAATGNSGWYDASLDRFVVKTPDTQRVYLVHPTTWAVAEQSTTGGAAITNAANGVFNKFVLAPNLGGFFYQPNHDSDGWFLATE